MKSKCTILVLTILLFSSCNHQDNSSGSLFKGNPCEEKDCGNGYCQDGDCICNDGYKGKNCKKEIVPSEVVINTIKLNDFPIKDGEYNWDNWSTYADLYFVLKKNNETIYKMEDYIEEAGARYYTLYDGSIVIEDPLRQCVIELYDYDSTSDDDLIGKCSFIPYEKGIAFPETLHLEEGNISFKLSIEYYWQ